MNYMIKLKSYCQSQLNMAKRTSKNREDMLNACSIAYGAVQFAIAANLVKYEQVTWWDDMRKEFWYGEYEKEGK